MKRWCPESLILDLLVKTIVYGVLAAALLNVAAAVVDEYTGVVHDGLFEVSGSSEVAVKATDPEGFRYQIAVKLLPSFFAVWVALYFRARIKMWSTVNACSPDFGGSNEMYGPEDEKNWAEKN